MGLPDSNTPPPPSQTSNSPSLIDMFRYQECSCFPKGMRREPGDIDMPSASPPVLSGVAESPQVHGCKEEYACSTMSRD